MPRLPGSSREAKKGNGERGRGVFCKNCPFPSRALPIPEKTFLPIRTKGPRRCLEDSDSLPVKMGSNSSHTSDKKKQQGAGGIRSGYPLPPVRIFQVNHTGDPGSPRKPAETSSQGIPLALPDSIIPPSPSSIFSPYPRRRRRAANMPSSQGWSWGVCHCTRRSRPLSSASSQSTACSFSSGCRVQVM